MARSASLDRHAVALLVNNSDRTNRIRETAQAASFTPYNDLQWQWAIWVTGRLPSASLTRIKEKVMAIEWRKSLETGIEEIDLQHKELFARINLLLEACNRGQGREEVLKMLVFLDDYIKTHFAAEENLQRRLGYPGYVAHRDQHSRFVREVDALERQFENEGATISLVIQTNRTMSEWLIQHISNVDRELADFARGQGVPVPA